MITCIADIECHENDIKEKMKELISIVMQARQLIVDNFYIYFTISVSNVNHIVTGISQAYKEALEAMEYKIVFGDIPVIRYQDVRKPSQFYSYSVLMEQKLSNYIKTGDFQNAREFLEQILLDNFSLELFSVEMGRYLIYDITGTIIKVLDSISGEFIGENHQYISDLLESKTLIEMKKQITLLLENACEYAHMHNKRSEAEDIFPDEIKQYVRNHYDDVNLSISMIGDMFKMTPAYLSKLFKGKTNQRLLDYINSVRLEEAKYLLKQNELSIQEISEKVGFSSSPALIRTFKKYTGITPGKYKEV